MTETIAAPAITRRWKVVLCGFWGRGNAGDEAFLHVQHSLLSPHFNIAIAVEQSGAHRNFRKWYPYSNTEVWNFDEVNRIYDEDVLGINIGGGSLPFASHGHFLLSAIDAGKKAIVTGVDASIRSDAPEDNIRADIYNRLSYFSVRHKRSLKLLRAADVKVQHGADWALGLKSDNSVSKDLDVVITFRGFSEPNPDHRNRVRALHRHLKAQGRRVTFLPFAPEDSLYLKYCGIFGPSVINVWHDPRKALAVIEKSQVTISVGRLHTLIFALIANKPCFAIDPGIMSGGKHIQNRKNKYFCGEMGLDFYDSIDEFINAKVDLGPDRYPPRGFPEDYQKRYNNMAEHVLSTLGV
jgi:SAM-dependent methyltransferase